MTVYAQTARIIEALYILPDVGFISSTAVWALALLGRGLKYGPLFVSGLMRCSDGLI